jgi:predicted ATPase/class 3 adenylate cyclase
VSSPPTGTITFLFTDIEGSTRMWEQDSEAMSEALARHDEILRDAIEEHGGFVFKTVGDAFCAAFPTAPDALEAALSAQRTLFAEEWGEPGPLRVRMALHTGVAQESEGDYFGPPLNRVARLLSAGYGGQVLLSLAAQELVRDYLPEGAGLRDLGERRLKDLFRTDHVFQLMTPDLPSNFPPLKTLDVRTKNLPAPRTSFIGREREMAEVKHALAVSRLLTLTGAGGSGKTRLALEVARDLAGLYADGVWLVELAALSEGELVPQAVAGALGVLEQPGQPFGQTLAEALRGKVLLLVLDNCEHLVDSVARLLDTLLNSCPRLRVLATSRETLGVEGEVVRRVSSLSVPDTDRSPAAGELSRYDAVRLFLDRVRLRLPNFDLTEENGPAVAEVCRKLEGMPLAIELAAARVGTLSVGQISERLTNSLKLLTSGGRTAAARQRTLRGTLDWSYDLLAERERVLFRRLSVFAGGWTLETAEAVVPAEDAEGSDMVGMLSALADKSLVVVDMSRDGGVRCRLLEPVRQYALEKLEKGGELGAIRHGHLEFFLALAEKAEPELVGAEQAEWLKRLEVELDNLRAALSWALGQGRTELGLRMGTALWRFWIMSARYGEGRKWLEAALAVEGEAPVLVRAKAALVAGYLAAGQGVYMRSQPHLEEALALYRSSGSAEGVAMTLATLGILASYKGDLERGNELYKESFDRYRKLGDPWQFSGALRALAADLFVRLLRGLAREPEDKGNFTRAVALREEALTLSRKWGDSAGVALSLLGLGYLAIDRDDPERAVKHLEESLVLAREVYAGIVPHILVGLGDAALIQGDNERALRVYKETLAICRKTGQELTDTGVLEGMASLAAALEDDARAARLWGALESALQAIGATWTPDDLALYEPYLDAARSRLGEAAWEAALAEGRNMALEEVIEYALEEEPSG